MSTPNFAPQEPVQATWSWYDENEKEHHVTLSLPGARHDIGIREDNDQLKVTTLELSVDEAERRQGKATRLLRAGLVLAATYNVSTSGSLVTSPYALKIRKDIFGDENIRFWEDRYYGGRTEEELPLTVDQAILSLQRAKSLVENPDLETEEDEGFIVVSDLARVDMQDWERPVEANLPEPPIVKVG